MSDSRIPVTILTGFLGAGKTTLLNRILTTFHGQRIAVIENEFGEIGIDHELVINSDEEIFEMNNGCICCTVRGDLIRILGNLIKRRDKFDRILIETTGLADPGPVIQTFWMDEDMKSELKLDGVVTLVDAKHILPRLEDSAEAVEQVAFADVIILNKCDLATPEELAAIESRIRGINATAKIHQCTRAEIPVATVLDIGGFDMDRIAGELAGHHEHEDHHDHEDHEEHEDHDHDHHHDPHHDESVTSVGIERPGDCRAEALNTWISTLLKEKGQDIFRMKGIFSVEGKARRVVFQGVHMLVDAAQGEPWGDTPRTNRLVFIGRNLDRAALNAGFDSCLVEAPAAAR